MSVLVPDFGIGRVQFGLVVMGSALLSFSNLSCRYHINFRKFRVFCVQLLALENLFRFLFHDGLGYPILLLWHVVEALECPRKGRFST